MSQFFTGSTGGSGTPNPIIFVAGVNVDMTILGNTIALFVPTSNFLLMDMFAIGTNVTNVGSNASFNLGWTGPNYTDFTFASNFGHNILANNDTAGWSIEDAGTPKIIPAGQTLTIQIQAASTKAHDIEKIYVVGFYPT